MAYLIYRVEITRDESRPSGTASIEITVYIAFPKPTSLSSGG
ncbi:MAG TPA: hypothetical protein VJX94_16635 [Stellaceae bacterium]|nr:hypothetical protein [Stellaceae bacterium]